jgi:hypothetical protein
MKGQCHVNSNLIAQPARPVAQRLMQALGPAMVACLAASLALAQDTDAPAAPAASVVLDASSPGREGAVVEIPLEPIVIESDMPNPEPTLDQLMQKFRALLAEPPSFIVSERQFSDGALEVITRFGRFCARPLPGSLHSGLGGDITLASPCASF